MANFILMYKGGDRPESEEKGAAMRAEWSAWIAALGTAIVEPGIPFGQSAAVASDGSVTDGAPSGLTGYTVVAADSLAAATALAKGCPFLATNGSIEVYETFQSM